MNFDRNGQNYCANERSIYHLICLNVGSKKFNNKTFIVRALGINILMSAKSIFRNQLHFTKLLVYVENFHEIMGYIYFLLIYGYCYLF